MGRYRESEPDVHPGRKALHRGIQEPLHLGKVDDFVKLLLDLAAGHSEYRAIEEDVFATGELRVKASPDLKEAGDAASEHRSPPGRLGNAAEDLQKCALARAVAADNAKYLALLDLEADVLQRPELLAFVTLDDLSLADDVERLAREIADFKPNDVAQRRVARAALVGTVPHQIAF